MHLRIASGNKAGESERERNLMRHRPAAIPPPPSGCHDVVRLVRVILSKGRNCAIPQSIAPISRHRRPPQDLLRDASWAPRADQRPGHPIGGEGAVDPRDIPLRIFSPKVTAFRHPRQLLKVTTQLVSTLGGQIYNRTTLGIPKDVLGMGAGWMWVEGRGLLPPYPSFSILSDVPWASLGLSGL